MYPSILGALKHLQPQPSGDDEGGGLYSPVLRHVVKVFQAFLGRLHKFALDEFARQEQERKRSKRATGRRTGNALAVTYAPVRDTNLATAKDLVLTLVRMLTMLDVLTPAHCELLEGCLCALLDHVGSSLSLVTFADHSGSRSKQTGILPPTGLLDIGQLSVETATGTATIEGPYMLFILRRGVDFLMENAKRMPAKSLSIFTVHQVDGDSDLRQRIQDTLQNTLLRGAFGDEDDTFYNSLRREDREDEETDLSKVLGELRGQETSAEWFIGELWEQLGWDILSGRRDV